MRVIKSTLLLATAVLLWGAAMASPVNPKRAAAVAQNFFIAMSGAKGDVVVEEVGDSWQFDGIYLFVVKENGAADVEANGFVLVSADDAARPILGYSTTGSMDVENIPPQLQQWLQGYQQAIDALRDGESQRVNKGNAAVASAYAAEWADWEQGVLPKDTSTGGVEPMLTTFWDQTFPYNGYCPRGTVTGCAATAQAQVMNFWKYPAFGEGSHSYTHTRYGLIEADFGHTLYDWDNMPSRATNSSIAEEQDAVALLMFHCGVSLDMLYASAAEGGSAAAGLAGMPGYRSIDNSLKDFFHYRKTMRVVRKDYGFTNAAWRDTLIAELDLGHPIVYVGSSEQGGHGFVCDGYDRRGYLHFNFGWSGRGDGYFPVDSISPGVGGVGGNVTYTFNMDNAALLGLEPDYALRTSDTLFYLPRNGGSDSLLVGLNEQLDTAWTVECDADWLVINADTFARAGRVRLVGAENNSGEDRVATVTFRQGSSQCHVRVMQNAYSDDEMCPLTVVMESTHGSGWQGGAHLSLQSDAGYVYGNAQLDNQQRDSVQILVAPHHINAVWHAGGGTDRYVNYTVKNQYGETLVSVQYAYRNGGTHHVEWPCAHVGIDSHSADMSGEVALYPNPVLDLLTIRAEGLQKVELMEMNGRRILSTTQPRIDMRDFPSGAYFVRIVTGRSTVVRRIVKQ